MRAHDLRAEGIVVGYDGREVLHGLDLAVPAGRVTVVVGANASGKSTLLRTLGRLLRPAQGRVILDGADVRTIGPRSFARVVGLLPQQPTAPDGITVEELVARGRHPHRGAFAPWRRADQEAVDAALAATGVAELAGRSLDELSGGQRQRVWIAMVLAQQTDLLLLDEPTTFLDLTHQLEVLDLVDDLRREHGMTVVMVLHDLGLAARYADHLVVMREGRIVHEGAPAEVLTEEVVREAFAVEARVVPDPETGTPLVVPRSRFPRA